MSALLEAPPETAQDRIVALRACGWSLEQIAEAVQVSWWTVYRWTRGTEPRQLQRSVLFGLSMQESA